jgi:hypothetical protein
MVKHSVLPIRHFIHDTFSDRVSDFFEYIYKRDLDGVLDTTEYY